MIYNNETLNQCWLNIIYHRRLTVGGKKKK